MKYTHTESTGITRVVIFIVIVITTMICMIVKPARDLIPGEKWTRPSSVLSGRFGAAHRWQF